MVQSPFVLPEGEACDDEQEEGEEDQSTTAVKLLLCGEGVEYSHKGGLWIERAARMTTDSLKHSFIYNVSMWILTR